MKFDISSSAPGSTQPNVRMRVNRIQSSEPQKNPDSYKIQKFPKQLKKRFYDSIEPRFAIILIISLLLHTVVILYLSKHYPRSDKVAITEKVRQRFANLLLEGKDESNFTLLQPESTDENLTNYNLLENTFDEFNAPIDKLLDLNRPITDLPSVEKRRSARDSRSKKRKLAIEKLSRDAERTGLLGVLTSNTTRSITIAEVANILDFADSTSDDLEKSLAFLRSLKVPRHFDPVAYASYANNSDISKFIDESALTVSPTIKGQRIASQVKVRDIVENLGLVKKVAVKKVQEYEAVPSSYYFLDNLRSSSNGYALPTQRNPETVREVVLSHYSAIQDCYSQTLKVNGNLKGKVVVRFVISSNGNVVQAEIISSTIRNKEMLDCILGRVLRWNDFPAIDASGGNMAIKQSYVFGF